MCGPPEYDCEDMNRYYAAVEERDRMLKKRYFLDSDGDDHWYVIEEDRRDEWDKWRDNTEGENAWETPPYARSLGGSYTCVTFTDPRTS